MAATTEIYRHRLTAPNPLDMSVTNKARWTFNYSMKRLFPDTEFGIEVLTAVIKNEINKAGTLEMDVILNENDALVPYRDFISVSDKYKEGTSLAIRDIIFFGRVINITCDATLVSHVTCEGYLACLADCPMLSGEKANPFKIKKGKNLKEQFSTAITAYTDLLKRGDVSWACNFARKADVPDSDVSISLGTSCGDFIVNTLVSTYGGVIRLEYSNNSIPFGNNKIKVIWQDGPNENPNYYEQTGEIKWKVNMLDASYETVQDEFFTGIIPWYEDSDNKKHTYGMITANGRTYPTYYLKTSLASTHGTILKSVGFKDCKDVKALKEKAKKWIARYCTDYGSQYTFKAIDMHYLGTYDTDKVMYYPDTGEFHSVDSTASSSIKNTVNNLHPDPPPGSPIYRRRIHVLDKVAVTYPPFMKYIDSKEKRNKMICISAEYDIMNPENDTFVIGPVVPPDISDIKFITRQHSGSNYGGGKPK